MISSPDLTEADRQAVIAATNTTLLSMGRYTAAFEQAFCDVTGARHAVAVSSGTAGLHLCVRAAGIGEGDLVITTPFSLVSSANVLLFEKAIPVFVDVDARTGNINPDLIAAAARNIEKNLPPRLATSPAPQALKALLPVHVFGQTADMDAIHAIATQHGLAVIEDARSALGATYHGRPAGTLGDFGVFAFGPDRPITTGEGGVILIEDERAAECIRSLRDEGRQAGQMWPEHAYLGYNYRMNEMSAALGAAQMARLAELLQKRKQVAAWYDARLSGVTGIEKPSTGAGTTRTAWSVYTVRFDPRIDRDDMARRLEARRVPVQPCHQPIHLQPYMVERFGYRPGDFPVTEDLSRRGLTLPFSSVMTEEQVEYVCAVIREEVRKR